MAKINYDEYWTHKCQYCLRTRPRDNAKENRRARAKLKAEFIEELREGYLEELTEDPVV